MDDEQKTEKAEELEAHETKTEEHKHHHAKEDSEEDKDKADAKESDQPETSPAVAKKHQKLLNWYKTHKKVSIPATVALFLVVFFAIPFARYSALGLFLKQEFSVIVVDSQTGKPVSSAQVALKGKTASTDGDGKATLRVPVGEGKLAITKTYYKTAEQEVVVPVSKPDAAFSVKLEATGRPIPISVVDSISRKPVVSAVLSAGASQATTDDKGQATLVVSTSSQEIKGTLSAGGYNETNVTIKSTTEEDQANEFVLTPAGKIYFLSNLSGKIDVVKSDLDGKNRKTVVAGTGRERKGETVLLATRDWKYLALQSKRDGGEYAKLFLIDTSKDSIVNMDEGEATFGLIGWEGHHFVYQVDRQKIEPWQPKRYALKSFNAETKKLTTLDQTDAQGTDDYDYARESYRYNNIIDGKLLFVKVWDINSYKNRLKGKSFTLNSISVSGGDKKLIKAFTAPSSVSYAYLSVASPGYERLYLNFSYSSKDTYYEYKNGQVTSLSGFDGDDFYAADNDITYLESPSKKQSFWYESRDGKRAFFAGVVGAKDPQRIMTLDSEYVAYGWFTDKYVLLSKKGSELYIAPVEGVDDSDGLLKVTDYYKPDYSYYGYGGGYGGL